MPRHFLLLIFSLVLIWSVTTTTHAAAVTDLKKIVLGQHHGCGITHTGTLRCFGNNGNGQLGTEQRVPRSFADYALTVISAGVTDVAIGNEHTCAVVDGKLFCWGSNAHGQLGTGKVGSDIMTPTIASAVSGGVTAVAAGWGTTCVILAPNGALQCWGRNDQGQVGSGSEEKMVLQPVTVIPSGVKAVAIGGQHACAVVDGGLQCWGSLLFRDDFNSFRNPMSIIPAGRGVTAVAAALHTCVIVKDSLQCWGRNFHNQVGVPEGARVAPKVPTTVIPSGVTAMGLSDENTCAVANGALMCWGANNSAQLGVSSFPGRSIPEPLPVPGTPVAPIRAVAIGMAQVCVLTGATTSWDSSLLQCTNRRRDPEEVDETETPAPLEQWVAFGTEGVGLSEPPPVLPRIARYGLWQGAIGAQQVMVQLAPTGQACAARYYYRKHLFGIVLTERDRRQGRVWTESQGTEREATWTFSLLSPDGRALTGEWASKDGRRRLPIRLNLLAFTPSVADEDGKPRYDCNFHDRAFDAPRIVRARKERTVAQKDSLFQGVDGLHRYWQVSVLGDRIKSFTSPDISRAPRLKQALDNWENESVSQFYDCAFGMAEGRDGDTTPDFSQELVPIYWSERLLVLRESYSNYCGGAHPSGGISGYRVWDLSADRAVDVWKWIKGSDHPGHITSKRLLKLLAARYSRRNEKGEGSCADVLTWDGYALFYPTTTGMVFSPSLSHAIQACEEDIEISWADMGPFLSPTGKKGLQILIGIP